MRTTIEAPTEERNSCHISIDDRSISIYWDHPLPDGPHKTTRVEMMAAAALIGIARVLTGKGQEDVLRAVANFERRGKK